MKKRQNTRTRYAPSPTGFMHIGNLRTALYEYLIAKSQGGDFILRIEDTDQNRYVKGATSLIYSTLKEVGLNHDEGPDIGGNYGPYTQSERQHIYRAYAEQLIKEGKAYYCFCDKVSRDTEQTDFSAYNRHCRDLTPRVISEYLNANKPYVIRQKMPLDGETRFTDCVYGEITTKNKELDDQILIKTDGFPTYNFANVIDDHLMHITHVVRGCEYLSSTPKYNLLYTAFGWEIPQYIHLPLIMGKNTDGSVSKLSKRHGSTSFEDLVNDGYLPQAIINYIALLGWCPKDTTELFSLDELINAFSVDRICKSPSIFDYDKLNWFNGEYIKKMSADNFIEKATPYFNNAGIGHLNPKSLCNILQGRITTFTQIPEMIHFFRSLPEYNINLFIHKKSKSTLESSNLVLTEAINVCENAPAWDHDTLHSILTDLAQKMNLKNGTVLWPIRIAISGTNVTPGGAIEILDILGRTESLYRLRLGLDKLNNINNRKD